MFEKSTSAHFDSQLKQKQKEEKLAETKNEKRIRQEQKEARERFKVLIDLVNARYSSENSTLANSPEQLNAFIAHNDELLDLCVQRGVEKGLSERNVRVLEVAAILHDLTKADQGSAETADIPNYILAAHGELAASEVPEILAEHPEVLSSIFGSKYTDQAGERITKQIQTAIRSHMGPHPGFMSGILAGVNKTLEKKGMARLEHTYPPADDKVAETLLAADMHSLAGRQGREKVLAIW
jgi:response regulator RpfG family c-di-GMP phosphodiesterase